MIALFGDVHGNLAGMYGLVERYNRKHGAAIDVVLQIGDLGAFPDPDKLDPATRRYANRDATELGFRAYHVGERRAPVDTWFIAGNHEDFDFLEAHADQAVDPDARLHCLGNGSVVAVIPGVTVAGLWGMSRSGPRRGKGDARKYVSEDACLRLLERAPGSVDILLCHDAPWNAGDGAGRLGARDLTEVIEHLRPLYVFHGHTGGSAPPWRLGRSEVVGLNAAGMVKVPGRDGGMAVVEPGTWQLHRVTDADL